MMKKDGWNEELHGLVDEAKVKQRPEDPWIFRNFINSAWWKNLLFYTSIVYGMFAIGALIIHTIWKFKWGILVAAVSVIILTLLVIRQVVLMSRKTRHSKINLTASFIIFFAALALQGFMVYYQFGLLKIHYKAPDPKWTDFPTHCSNNSYGQPIMNCVRAGLNIANPSTDYYAGQITVPSFNSSEGVQYLFEESITSQMGCILITSDSGFTHARCLTMFEGYPDDLALKYFEGQNSTIVWIHSQSRLGVWDYNVNDARVRLLIGYVELTLNF